MHSNTNTLGNLFTNNCKTTTSVNLEGFFSKLLPYSVKDLKRNSWGGKYAPLVQALILIKTKLGGTKFLDEEYFDIPPSNNLGLRLSKYNGNIRNITFNKFQSTFEICKGLTKLEAKKITKSCAKDVISVNIM